MRDKYYGKLTYDPATDRIDILYNDGTREGGLHCGQTMEVKIDGKWIQTRIEMSGDWYLVGIKGLDSLIGLEVRL